MNSKTKSLLELVAPWRTAWRCESEKKHRAPFQFQEKIPCKLQVIIKKHFNFPGNFKPILENESVVSLWRKQHFLLKRSQPLARFSPRRDVLDWQSGFYNWISNAFLPSRQECTLQVFCCSSFSRKIFGRPELGFCCGITCDKAVRSSSRWLGRIRIQETCIKNYKNLWVIEPPDQKPLSLSFFLYLLYT